MSLDLSFVTPCCGRTIESLNVTHNLAPLARRLDVYDCLWHPERAGIKRAAQLIGPLGNAVLFLGLHRHWLRSLEPENGWGNLETFETFMRRAMILARENPDAKLVACG